MPVEIAPCLCGLRRIKASLGFGATACQPVLGGLVGGLAPGSPFAGDPKVENLAHCDDSAVTALPRRDRRQNACSVRLFKWVDQSGIQHSSKVELGIRIAREGNTAFVDQACEAGIRVYLSLIINMYY
jgi:hypothetical protein